MNNTDLVALLRSARQAAGLSQAELAKRLGVTPGSIGLYESHQRRPPLELAERWARATGRRLVVMVTEEGEGVLVEPAERELVNKLRALNPGDYELLLRLAKALPGHPVARQAVRAAVEVLASTAASDARGPPTEPANDKQKAVPRTA